SMQRNVLAPASYRAQDFFGKAVPLSEHVPAKRSCMRRSAGSAGSSALLIFPSIGRNRRGRRWRIWAHRAIALPVYLVWNQYQCDRHLCRTALPVLTDGANHLLVTATVSGPRATARRTKQQ